jgi:soluble lytic murein transglycosylase-like protein
MKNAGLILGGGLALFLAFRPKTVGAGTVTTGENAPTPLYNAPSPVEAWRPVAASTWRRLNRISTNMILAVIWQESAGRAGAVGSSGEIGLMQIMPGTAREMGYNPQDLWNAELNIEAGAKYLAKMLDEVERRGSARPGWDMLRAYNAGAAGAMTYGRSAGYADSVMNKFLGTRGVVYGTV